MYVYIIIYICRLLNKRRILPALLGKASNDTLCPMATYCSAGGHYVFRSLFCCLRTQPIIIFLLFSLNKNYINMIFVLIWVLFFSLFLFRLLSFWKICFYLGIILNQSVTRKVQTSHCQITRAIQIVIIRDKEVLKLCVCVYTYWWWNCVCIFSI